MREARNVDISALKLIIESILLINKEPVTIDKLLGLFSEEDAVDAAQIKQAIGLLQMDLASRSFELVEVASGYRLQVKQDYARFVQVLWEEKPPRYSRAILETLALIAYQQPITRAEIEEVRGVSVSSHIIKTLQDREWIKVVGHRDVVGRPALFATTKQFLDYFNLASLRDLPDLPEPAEIDLKQADDKLVHQLELAMDSDFLEAQEQEAAAAMQDEIDRPFVELNESDDLESTEDDEPLDFSAIEAVLVQAELAISGKDLVQEEHLDEEEISQIQTTDEAVAD
jgi:segregation and condensation protein B